LLISAALISLVQVQRVAGWMAVLIIGREFAVSGLRSIAASTGVTIPASDLGKTKMVAQVVAIALILVSADWPALAPAATVCLWGAMVFALISALGYFRTFWHRLDEGIKARRRTELIQLERQHKKLERLRKKDARRAAAARG
jgi:CDP-diacylglycerol--glycerol-3-phosphate 3-phosphatidyltransferase